MRILFATGSPAHYMAPPRLAEEQVNCGPYFPDRQIGGSVVSLRTPKGEYDLFSVASRLPPDQQPDAVVCLVDSSRLNQPGNLAAFRCPRILLLADTHHLANPLLGMVNYMAAQRFDRVVVLYTRHHLELFRAAGIRNLCWFPGLTFPHGDAAIRAAARPSRAARLALVGQAGGWHQRRLRLAGALAAASLPIEVKAISQAEGLEFYGASLIGFNASLNADLNLRAFEVLSAGAMLLTDRLSPESGQAGLWQEGRELVTYADEGELVERARHYLARPDEARAIGAAGQRWFLEHFGEDARRRAFAELVWDGRVRPEFAVPEPAAPIRLGGDHRRLIETLAVYEQVQRAHARQETVRVALEAAAPADLDRVFGTLPRVRCVRTDAAPGATPPDLLVTGAAAALAAPPPTAPRVWCWDAAPGDLPRLRARFGPAGLIQAQAEVPCFHRALAEAPPEIDRLSANARTLLQAGDANGAFATARQALAENPRSIEAHLVMAELALEAGKRALAAKLLAQAQAIDPREPRVALLGMAAAEAGPRSLQPARLLGVAWDFFDRRDWRQAIVYAKRALEADPGLAEAFHVYGHACLQLAQGEPESWQLRGAGVKALRAALARAPARAGYALDLAQALREAGLFPEAAAAYRTGLAQDGADAIGWLGLGEAHLATDRPDEAAAAFREGLARSPGSRMFMKWLGHAAKRQGRIDEAMAWHRRAEGLPEAPETRAPGGRRRVVFAVQHGPSWPCLASVHAAFASDPAWETTVVALPYLHPYYAKSADQQGAIFAFLEGKGIPHVRWDRFKLEPGCADLMFLQNPYDVTRPEGWRTRELLPVVPRLAYVPYAIEIGGTIEDATFQFNLPLQQLAWAVFARSEAHRAMFERHCLAGGAHVIATGHPKFDRLAAATAPDPELTAWARGRPIVLWNPHFDVRLDGTRFGAGYSTFLRWRDFLPEEFARRGDLAFVVRPHPLFFPALEERGILTAGQIEEFRRRCTGPENIRLDRRPDYEAVLAAADALVSDCSSLLVEFGISGKPVCHLHNPHGPLARLYYELDLDWVRQHCAWATTEDELVSFLDRIAAGDRGGGEDRAADLRRRMGVRPDGIGAAIKRAVETRLEPAGQRAAA